MLLYKEEETILDGMFAIYDTDDGVIEQVDLDTVVNAVRGGVKIENLPPEVLKLTKSKNSNLVRAKKAKNDEFYTQLTDIEKELSHYNPEIFKDKVIYCPTDVATDQGKILQSQFVHYFQLKKNDFKFKKLIATCLADKGEQYNNKYVLARKLSPYADKTSVYYNPNITEDDERYYSWGESTTECKADDVYGSGDFRSEECQRIFDEADFVITNPPFSLFRDFFNCVIKRDLKFLIIGSINEVIFDSVFDAFKNNKCWRGVTIHNGHTKFLVPDWYSTVGERSKFKDGHKYSEVGVRWYTNIDNSTRHEEYIPYKTYRGHESEYHMYDGTDILHIEKSADTPLDYSGIMGVPVTFLDRLNPKQFEILGLATPSKCLGGIQCRTKVNGKNKYARILIRVRDRSECKYSVGDYITFTYNGDRYGGEVKSVSGKDYTVTYNIGGIDKEIHSSELSNVRGV